MVLSSLYTCSIWFHESPIRIRKTPAATPATCTLVQAARPTGPFGVRCDLIPDPQPIFSRAASESLVLTTSVSAAVAKPGSIADNTSKTAINHLMREAGTLR